MPLLQNPFKRKGSFDFCEEEEKYPAEEIKRGLEAQVP